MTMLREVTSEKGASVDMDVSERTGWLCPKCRTAVNPVAQICPVCNEVRTTTELYSTSPTAKQLLLG